jgi:regulator of protease activity HflC (stomatin/prohibitin superfamily)
VHRGGDPARQQLDPRLAAAPIVIGTVLVSSLVIVQPGQTKVVRFFGSYVGTVRQTGLSWIVPLPTAAT